MIVAEERTPEFTGKRCGPKERKGGGRDDDKDREIRSELCFIEVPGVRGGLIDFGLREGFLRDRRRWAEQRRGCVSNRKQREIGPYRKFDPDAGGLIVLVVFGKSFANFGCLDSHDRVVSGDVGGRPVIEVDADGALFESVAISSQRFVDDVGEKLFGSKAGAKGIAVEDGL